MPNNPNQLYEVTIKIADNPLRGQPGQSDFTLTISSEPDLELPKDGSLPDPDTLSPALLGAMHCVASLANLTYETAFVHIARGGSN